jgi:hypothetical protein
MYLLFSFPGASKIALAVTFFCTLVCLAAKSQTNPQFEKTILTRDFLSEGVAVGDLNRDGVKDIIAGYFWFEAPNWDRHELSPSKIYDPRKEYSQSFLNLGMDVNLDGWDDVVIIDYPGTPAYWFENPKNQEVPWEKHIIADSLGIANESPGFIDINGDGRLDILCGDADKKQIVWLQAPTKPGEEDWAVHAISKEGVDGTDRYSHGIGYGDINGDGINDVVIIQGWFEGKPEESTDYWDFHPANLGEPASHMQVIDINNDGRNDVMTASAHGLGIWWHEQMEDGTFETHLMDTTTSQTHSTYMADLNGDGQKEFITGKRYLAHNGNDAGDAETPYLFYFTFTPHKAPYFKQTMIDEDSGAGLNISVEDINGDSIPDIIIANKNGVFLFENNISRDSKIMD